MNVREIIDEAVMLDVVAVDCEILLMPLLYKSLLFLSIPVSKLSYLRLNSRCGGFAVGSETTDVGVTVSFLISDQ